MNTESNAIDYTLFGKKEDYTWQEDILATRKTKKELLAIQSIAMAHGYTSFRISSFTGTEDIQEMFKNSVKI